jgi:4-nitrophenyl phosphatase
MNKPRVYVFDLDGVLYRGEEAVDGAADTLARLRAQESTPLLYFLTNNSTQPRRVYAEKLTRLNMPCTEAEIVTSASASAAYLVAEHGAEGKTALAVGGPGISEELSRVGVLVKRPEELPAEPSGIDFVVVGLDRNFNYHSLFCAQQAILRGAMFVATNRDGQYPIENGRVSPGAGTMVAALQACTDITPIVVGKPEPLGLETILRMANATPEEAVMIGDRLDTDILCGNRVGVPSVLVLTGVTTRARAESAEGDLRPGRIIEDLRDL